VAVQKSLPEGTFELLKGLTQESSLTLTGKIRAENRAANGFEMEIEGVSILQRVPETDPYPITPKDHGIDFLMDHRHLWLRTMRQSAIARIRHTIIDSVQRHLNGQGFTLVNAPILSNLAFAGNGTAFKVCENQIFDEEAFLSQTAQPYNEAAAMALGNVYSFGPVFSAEISKTRRDLVEYWQVEPEMPFADLEAAEQLARKLVDLIVGEVLCFRLEELMRLERDASKLGESWGKGVILPITYDQAIAQVQAFGSDTQWGTSFSGTDQTLLTQDLTTPLMVERFPQSAIGRQFLQADEQRPEVVLGFTMLAPEGYGEIISGGQRICDYAQLMKEVPADSPLAGWYADLRKFGTVPHAGFSMNIERMVAWICSLEHIRETIAFPRMVGRLTP